MIREMEIEEFLRKAKELPVIDVRAPSEYAEGHIAGAFNIPLFSDEERAMVGTLYKQVGKEEAILKGLEFVGPKMRHFVEEAKRLSPERNILVHCWRGGMRSSSMAWLFSTVGMRVALLKGGYKNFRTYARKSFEEKTPFLVLGGMTGTGKTQILQELGKLGHQIIDLEALARHMGSAFGGLKQTQPTQEQFENELFKVWQDCDKTKLIIVEDESRHVGRIQLPTVFYEKIRSGKILKLILPQELRAKRLVKDYEEIPPELLKKAFMNISSQLGGLVTKEALEFVDQRKYEEAATLALAYYDKTYLYGLTKRKPEQLIDFKLETLDAATNAKAISDFLQGNTL